MNIKLIVVNTITNEETIVATFKAFGDAILAGTFMESKIDKDTKLRYYIIYREKGSMKKVYMENDIRYTMNKVSIQIGRNESWENCPATFHDVLNAPSHAQVIADVTGHAVRMTYIREHSSTENVCNNNGHYFHPKRVYSGQVNDEAEISEQG